ncbi:MAG: polysaccharide pyruvyl transferase family protein [Pseudomonadales bacterium]|nr:polysaccharide pyruvyl transferase family protein [Pseudomonadales bacterium]
MILVDFWSEKNRGDAMMQVAMLDLFQGLQHVVVLDSGANEYREFSTHMTESLSAHPELLFTPAPKLSHFFRPPGRVHNLLNKLVLVLNLLLVPMWSLLYRWRLIFLIPRSVKRTFDAISSADIVLWNGRNFRSNSALLEFLEFFDLSTMTVSSFILRKQVVALGVSVWPMRSRLGRLYLRWLFHKCKSVYARESSSYDYIQQFAPRTKLFRIPDLSFYYLRRFPRKEKRANVTKTIGIVVKDPVRRNGIDVGQYANAIARFVTTLSSETDIDIRMISQAGIENEAEEESMSLLMEKFSSEEMSVTRTTKNPSIEQLVHEYLECDFVISSRMHACIACAYLGVPFLAIPYDWGAKWSILSDLGDFSYSPMEELGALQDRDYADLVDQALEFDIGPKIYELGAQLESLKMELV